MRWSAAVMVAWTTAGTHSRRSRAAAGTLRDPRRNTRARRRRGGLSFVSPGSRAQLPDPNLPPPGHVPAERVRNFCSPLRGGASLALAAARWREVLWRRDGRRRNPTGRCVIRSRPYGPYRQRKDPDIGPERLLGSPLHPAAHVW